MNARWVIVGICLTLAGACRPAVAQDKPVEIEQSGMQPAIQTGRPIPSWWDVKIRGSALLEGRFEFHLMNDSKLLASTTTEELALTGPQQRIRVVLPPVSDNSMIEQLQLKIQFHGKRFNQDLGTHILRVASPRKRSFVVLTAASRLAPRRSVEREQIYKRLAFESLANSLDDSCQTVASPLEPSDVPQDAISFCAYEMVILFSDEFRLLKKPQLEALAAWIRAGGSLYVEPTGVLEPYHVDFLRRVTAAGPGDLIIQPDSSGRLMPGTVLNDERLILLHCGLGRVALRIEEEQPEFSAETPQWRKTAAFLWRLHADQVKLLEQKSSVTMTDLLQNRPHVSDAFGGVATGRMTMKLRTSTSELNDWLMPKGVRMVPLWVLAIILTTFVIVIGPVDYFALGWLRARKFTWLTFPLATLLVTMLTVSITNAYMSSSETRRGLILQDVGDDGSIVRTTRFELLFTASSRPVETDVRRGIFAALDGTRVYDDPYQQAMMSGRYPAYSRYGADEAGVERPPARMKGRIPTEYAVTQQMAKWTPQLNRVSWIPGPETTETPVDWNALMQGIDTRTMSYDHNLPGALQARLQTQFGANALMAFIGPQNRWAYNLHGDWRRNAAASNNVYMNYYQETQPMVPNEIQGHPAMFRWLYQHSVAMSYGVFSLTSQSGPTGAADMNDLPILDSENTRQGLLIVVVPKADDFIVYRKLVRLEE
jgi:hypothetical protein